MGGDVYIARRKQLADSNQFIISKVVFIVGLHERGKVYRICGSGYIIRVLSSDMMTRDGDNGFAEPSAISSVCIDPNQEWLFFQPK